MLVNYKNANVLAAECGKGEPKLILVPGLNVVDDAHWERPRPPWKATLSAAWWCPLKR